MTQVVFNLEIAKKKKNLKRWIFSPGFRNYGLELRVKVFRFPYLDDKIYITQTVISDPRS